MQVFEKIIEKLKKLPNENPSYYHTCDVIDRELAIEVVEEVAEEQNNGWIPTSNPPKDEDAEYILCVSGKDGNITYENAVLLGPNYYEDGKWYINGVLKDNVEVLAYMPSPEPYQQKGE